MQLFFYYVHDVLYSLSHRLVEVPAADRSRNIKYTPFSRLCHLCLELLWFFFVHFASSILIESLTSRPVLRTVSVGWSVWRNFQIWRQASLQWSYRGTCLSNGSIDDNSPRRTPSSLWSRSSCSWSGASLSHQSGSSLCNTPSLPKKITFRTVLVF